MPRIGSSIKIIENKSGHHYNIGEIYKISRIEVNGVSAYSDEGRGGDFIRNDEYEVIYDNFSAKTLENREKELINKIEKSKFVLNYLEENNLEECLPSEINASIMLKYLNSNNLKELAKIINEINSGYSIEKLNHH